LVAEILSSSAWASLFFWISVVELSLRAVGVNILGDHPILRNLLFSEYDVPTATAQASLSNRSSEMGVRRRM
jgi:hypothetical protein